MIGQKNLLNKINSYTLDSFPHTSLFIGENGCGKHTLIKHLADNILKLTLIDITNLIDEEYIDNIYRAANPAIYLVNMTELTEVKQNILLKFAEEPLKNAYVVLLAENKNILLDTIINRCIVFEFESYSKEELSNFISEDVDKDLVLSLLRTPGRILNTNISNLLEMKDICDKMIEKMHVANFSNTLTIADKINYSDEYNKFDIQVFLDMLSSLLLSEYMSERVDKIFNLYKITLEAKKKLIDNRTNKQILIQNFLTQFWKESRK